MDNENGLPVGPPRLHDVVILSNQQIADIQAHLGQLSESLQWVPVVFSQDGQLISYAGVDDEAVAEAIARNAAQLWSEGATRIAREYISFEEKKYGELDQHSNLILYSAHVRAALTLSVGVEFPSSLTTIRQQVDRTRVAIKRIVLAG